MPVDQKVLPSRLHLGMVLSRELHQGMVYVHHRPVLPFLTFNCSQDPEERRKESGSEEQNGEQRADG
jgi:hypothetical protein